MALLVRLGGRSNSRLGSLFPVSFQGDQRLSELNGPAPKGASKQIADQKAAALMDTPGPPHCTRSCTPAAAVWRTPWVAARPANASLRRALKRSLT